MPSAVLATNHTSLSKDPSGDTPLASHGAGAPVKSAHEDTGSKTRDASSSTAGATADNEQNSISAAGKEADAEYLNLNTETIDQEDITRDEAQDSDETNLTK